MDNDLLCVSCVLNLVADAILTNDSCLLIWITAWIILGLNYFGDLGNQASLQTLWNDGFGNMSPGSTIRPTLGLSVFFNVLIANAPQIIVSLAYVLYNGLWTCMILSREFLAFARKRHGLRVTNPEGKYQRSTYWLSLPYRFSLPLLGLSAAFHWILSQTLFLVEIRVFTPEGVLDPDNNDSISIVGWSALSVIITLILGTLLMAGPLVAGCFRYDSNIPIVESCSLAISAACHPPGQGSQADALLKYGTLDEGGEERVALSSATVDTLEEFERYTSRPHLKELTAEQLPSYPASWLRKQRTLESLVSTLRLLQFSIATMSIGLIVDSTSSQWGSIESQLAGLPSPFPGFALQVAVAGFTAFILLIRKLFTCCSRTHSKTTGWDVLIDIILL